MHLQQDQSHARWRFGGVTRNRAIGGAMALAGTAALISFLGKGHLVAVVVAAGLFLSSLVLITAVVTTETARHSVNTLRAWRRIASYAGTESAELEAQLSIAIKDTGLMQVRVIEESTPLVWTTQEVRAQPGRSALRPRKEPCTNQDRAKAAEPRNILSGT